MKAYELMYLAKREPQKYEGKKYKVVGGHAFDNEGGRLGATDIINVEKGEMYFNNIFELNISQHTELEEIQPSVDFLTAVKAYSEGKTIRWTNGNGTTYIYKPDKGKFKEMVSQEFSAITDTEILEGQWYIKEDCHE
jgi:hypothetical protein